MKVKIANDDSKYELKLKKLERILIEENIKIEIQSDQILIIFDDAEFFLRDIDNGDFVTELPRQYDCEKLVKES